MGCHGCRTVLLTPSRSAVFNTWLLGSSAVLPMSGLCHVNGSRAVPTAAWQLTQPVAGSAWLRQHCPGSRRLPLPSRAATCSSSIRWAGRSSSRDAPKDAPWCSSPAQSFTSIDPRGRCLKLEGSFCPPKLSTWKVAHGSVTHPK